MTEIKIGNGHTQTITLDRDELYPSPLEVKKAELARICFEKFTEMANELERLSKRLKALEQTI
jgi:hypothetical protein